MSLSGAGRLSPLGGRAFRLTRNPAVAMIYIVTRHDHAHTVERLAQQSAEHGAADIRLLSYGDLFARRIVPVGHYVFTDFDRLSSYEMQVAETIARHIEEAAPDAKILNRPAVVLERYPLLRALARMGLNDFSAVRVDAGELPGRYPAFVRLEDDCKFPDTPLLHSEAELVAAIDGLKRSGLPLKRRIAVEFCAERGSDGFYRKYGVFRLGDRLVPQHVMLRDDWYVKRGNNPRPPPGDDDPHQGERMHFLKEFPHADAVMERFKIARIEFGRIDYTFVGGRMQTYEINTNPTFPPLWSDEPVDPRAATRALLRERILGAIAELDTPLSGVPETVKFKLPEPRLQVFQPLKPLKEKKSKRAGEEEDEAETPPA